MMTNLLKIMPKNYRCITNLSEVNKMTRLFLSIIVVVSTVFISSCSIFQSSKKINMAPFSDNAGTLFSEATKVSRPFQWKHLKPYTRIDEFQNVGPF